MMVENVNFAPSAAGDIVLNAPRQKSKKPLVIGAIVLVASIVVFALIAIVLNNSTLTAHYSPADTQTSFLRYANYVLSGEENSSKLLEGSFSTKNNYKIKEMLYIVQDDKAYFEQLKNYYDEFYSKALNSDLSEGFLTRVKNYNDIFHFVYAYATNDIFDDEDIMTAYLEESPAAAEKIVNGTYNIFSGIGSAESLIFADDMKTYGNNVIATARQLQKDSCINGSDEIVCDLALYEDADANRKLLESADSIIKFEVKNLISMCWDLQSEFSIEEKESE